MNNFSILTYDKNLSIVVDPQATEFIPIVFKSGNLYDPKHDFRPLKAKKNQKSLCTEHRNIAKKLIEESSSNKAATRFEIALICSEVYTKVKGNTSAASNVFSDVPANHWAAKAVNLMGATKLMEGHGDGTFRGDKNMTRYEAAILLAKLYKLLSA